MKRFLNKYLILLIAAVGIISTIELAIVYYNANFVIEAAPSFCNFTEKLDCDAVAKTSYAIFLGVPLALWGLSFYLFIMFMEIVPFLQKKINLEILNLFKNPRSYIFTFSLLSVVISIYLSWVSITQIHKACVVCYFTYILNFIILVLSKSDITVKQHFLNTFNDLKAALSKSKYRIMTMLFMGVLFVVLFYTNHYKLFVSEKLIIGEQLGFDYTTDYVHKGNVLGSMHPKVIIHEYTDFQCPFCGISNAMMNRLITEVDDVAIVHHDLPLDPDCNPRIKGTGHKNSCLASRYSRAAKLQENIGNLIIRFSKIMIN